MINNNLVENAFKKSLSYLIQSDYTGYDPYDGSSSRLQLIAGNKYGRIFSTYLNKFSPVNVRRLLKIPATRQNQALAFVGRAMLYDYDSYKDEIKKISDHLISESLIGTYGYHCWDAHGFPIQMRNSYRPSGKTDIIGDEAVGRYFLDLYRIDPQPQYKEICNSVAVSFIDRHLKNYQSKTFFKYTPETPITDWCYNASVIGGAYVAAVWGQFNSEHGETDIERPIRDVISRQKPDGEWWYSLDLETGYEKQQIDFHQGFILDALLDYMTVYGYIEPFMSSYKRGLEFYYSRQFLPNGRGIYRYPKKYPVNIHNQAQGIITFSKAAEAGFGDHFLEFAHTIAQWTIDHMQDPDGHFYFLKYPLFTNRIPYIRWSDSAMVYALSVLLSVFDRYGRNEKNAEINLNNNTF